LGFGLVYGIERRFQQYFSYIMAVSFIGGTKMYFTINIQSYLPGFFSSSFSGISRHNQHYFVSVCDFIVYHITHFNQHIQFCVR
jgi:uncharacterized protein YfaT (DUF1175 family)